MNLTCKCCGEVICKFEAAARDTNCPRNTSPEEVLRRYDLPGIASLGCDRNATGLLADALRAALKQRDTLAEKAKWLEGGNTLNVDRVKQLQSELTRVTAEAAVMREALDTYAQYHENGDSLGSSKPGSARRGRRDD